MLVKVSRVCHEEKEKGLGYNIKIFLEETLRNVVIFVLVIKLVR